MGFGSLLLPLGIIPAIFAVYGFTYWYEGKLKEKVVYFSFIIGIIMGLFIYILELSSFPFPYMETIGLNVIIFLSIAFSFLEQISKLMVLNLHFFSGEGLPLYGASFGSGFASSFAPIFIRSINLNGYNMLAIVIPIAVILLTSYSGILIGIGVKKNKRARYFFYAFLFSLASWIITIASFFYIYLSIVLFLFAILSLYHAFKRLLPFSMLSRAEIKKFL